MIDDGRRYLERTTQSYDLITVDPPPPVEAAGSSLLYSEEFYAVARKRLRPGGILAQWFPEGDAEDFAAVARALRNSFPYVRVFGSMDGWGLHFLASEHPLPAFSAEDLQRRVPADAIADLTEWDSPGGSDAAFRAFDTVLQNEIPIETVISRSPATPSLRDDRPINVRFTITVDDFAARVCPANATTQRRVERVPHGRGGGVHAGVPDAGDRKGPRHRLRRAPR